jgi:hypothetical protein
LDVDEDGDYKTGRNSVRKEAVAAWTKCWKNMSQARIRRWISRIIRHIQIVICWKVINKYKEGSFEEGGVAGETGEWVDLGALELDLPESDENTI